MKVNLKSFAASGEFLVPSGSSVSDVLDSADIGGGPEDLVVRVNGELCHDFDQELFDGQKVSVSPAKQAGA